MGKLVIRDDLADPMKAEIVLEEVDRAIRANYNLRDLCRVLQTGEALTVDIPLITSKVAGQMNVPELEEAAISSQSYDHIRSQLHKNITHVALSKEAQLESKFDILRMHVEDAGKEIAHMENIEIAAELDTFDSDAADDWTDDQNDPFDDIMDAVTTIRNNHFEPTQMWMEPAVHSALLSNGNIMDRLQRGATADGQLTTMAGIQIRVDNELSDETVYFVDPTAPALMLFDGPEWINEYSHDTAFYDGYIIADFLGIERVQPDACHRLTGCLS